MTPDAARHLRNDICGRLIVSLRHEIKGRLRIGDIVETLKERAYALLILLLTLANGVPGPAIPGLSTITGVPVLVFAIEAAFGRRTPRLPRLAARMRLNRYKVIRHLERIRPFILSIEGKMRPRLRWIVARQRLNFALCAFYAVVLAVPIPAGNLVSAWAIIILSLGLIMDDGIAVLVGHAIGVFAVFWNILIVVLGVEVFYYLTSYFSS